MIIVGDYGAKLTAMSKFCRVNKLNSLNLEYMIKYGTQANLKKVYEAIEESDYRVTVKLILAGYLKYMLDVSNLIKTLKTYWTLIDLGWVNPVQTKNNFNFKVVRNETYKHIPKEKVNQDNYSVKQDTTEFQMLFYANLLRDKNLEPNDWNLAYTLELCKAMEQYCISRGYLNCIGRKKEWRT